MKTLARGRLLLGIAVFILLFFIQVISGKAGTFFANRIPYQGIDPDNSFAGNSIHHAVMLIIGVIVAMLLSKALKTDFYFQLGDIRLGKKYLAYFTLAFAVISVAVHVFLLVCGQLPAYGYPLNVRNVLGTLGFQLFLTGPAEEVVYRALPITMLVYAFGKSIPIKGYMTLEVLLASLLFAFAHTSWSINPFVIEVNFFRVLYSFVLGCIQGIAYQRCKSILYPMLMHSFSNVLMVGVGYLFIA